MGLDFKKSNRRFRRLVSYFIVATSVFATTFVIATSDQTDVTEILTRIAGVDLGAFQGDSPAIRVWGLESLELGKADKTDLIDLIGTLVTGKTLTCQIRDIDENGRVIGHCMLPDGRDLADELIRIGAASENCRMSDGYYGTC